MWIKHWFYTVPLRLRSLFRRSQVEQELDEEIRYHIERQIEEHIAKGMTPEEARHAALRAMGGVEQRKEECRDTRRVRLIEDLAQDLRYGLRTLRKSPGFTAVAVLSLALGIGANTAIFSVVNVLLFKPLPYPGSERLMQLYKFNNASRRESPMWEYPKFEMLRDQNRSFDLVAAFTDRSATITGDEEPERVKFEFVSASYFPLLGLSPVIGRTFSAKEDRTPS